jgi:hypothetical protein
MAAGGLDQNAAQDILDQVSEARDNIFKGERQLDRMEDALRRWGKVRGSEDLAEAFSKKRRAAVNIVRRNEFFIKSMDLVNAGLEPDKAISSLLMGSQADVPNARSSISRRRAALEKEFLGPIAYVFRKHAAIARALAFPVLPGRRARIDGISRNIVAEMMEVKEGGKRGISGSKPAGEIAHVFSTSLEGLRLRMNRAGGDIGKLAGYVPQKHDTRRIRRAGRGEWVRDVKQWLDLERTFENASDVELELGQVFKTLTLGKHFDKTLAEMGLPGQRGNIARRFGEHRVLFFKDADAWQAYHEKYGSGNIFISVLEKIHRASRALSAMEALGTNPQTGLQSVVDKFKREIAAGNLKVKNPGQLMDLLESGKIITGRGHLGRALAEVMGETLMPENLTAAKIASGSRAVISMAKLGSAVLSAVADLPIIARNLRFHSQGGLQAWASTLGNVIEKFQGKQREEFTYLFDAFVDGVLGDISSRWTLEEPGAMSTAMGMFFKASGLTGWTDFWRSGAVRMNSAWLGMHADRNFNQLPVGMKQTFKLHGITPEKWEVLRKLTHEAADGKRYIVPEKIDGLAAEDLARLIPAYESAAGVAETWGKRAPGETGARLLENRRARMIDKVRDGLRSDLLGFYADEAAFSVLEADDKTRFLLLQGTRPGTMAGEVLRFAAQFKGFPVAQINRTWGRALYGSTRTTGAKVVDIASLMATMTAFGFVSMTLKDLAKGKQPRDISDPDKAGSVLMAAFLQGGGAGIFSDYLFSRYNRYGGGLSDTLVGPVIAGPVADAASLWADVVEGKPDGAKALRTLVNNAPFANLWWARSALNYLFMYELEELMTPGVHRRRERNMREEYGQEYFIPPSEWTRD